jgi:predicted DNA-binding helix-hairpin-helix protein
LRIPGVGVKSAKKIVQARKFGKIYTYQLQRLGIAFNRSKYFMICADTKSSMKEPEPTVIRRNILQSSSSKFLKQDPQQLTLFV